MKGTSINSYAPDFELPGVDGGVHHLARYLEKFQVVGVVFLSNQSAHVQLYIDRLKQIQQDYQGQGVILVGINPNDIAQSPEDNFEEMKIFAASHGLNFPYVRDVTQDVAASFGAELLPEAFLLDHQGVLRYRGQIDDSPETPESVSTPYLRLAITQLLQNQSIDPVTTIPVGDPICWRR
ncbi:MAG: thioredoxin family protein [Oscillatoriales cyanobacterium RM2_1_1]|nr:thioredoxin family protein [Oscillatoriales cyanobacterium SM2_3_0]NJO44550.1 thioredoxin family protein [Oscillatoriales cyanobacterium RM2_1_1]